jgi:hypothetical protein
MGVGKDGKTVLKLILNMYSYVLEYRPLTEF